MNVTCERSMTAASPRSAIGASRAWIAPTVDRSCSPWSSSTHGAEPSPSTRMLPGSPCATQHLPVRPGTGGLYPGRVAVARSGGRHGDDHDVVAHRAAIGGGDRREDGV